MPPLIEIKPVDRDFYESRIRDFLPDRIIDVHAHVWVGGRLGDADATAGRVVTWPARVAAENPVEDLLETYRLLLPGKSVTPLIFSNPTVCDGLDALNRYVAVSAARHRLPALALTAPDWTAEQFEERIAGGGLLGAKPYLTFAPAHIAADEIRIYDFLPPHQLEVLDRRGWIAMLHIPRPLRLRDPANLAQMVEIEQRYPNVKVIVAHVGRAYCIEDVGSAFEALAATRRMCFDISANTNAEVFGRLLDAVGPKRVLFGSDMPILRMRMRRIGEHGRYVNLVPAGLYGDVSGDPHMRQVEGEDAERLTLFLYEEIAAFRRAADAANLTPADVEDIFHNNARRLLDDLAAPPR